MKRTLTVNLGSMVYTIDEDGYNLLQSYLNNISAHLGSEECNEVMKDIELRIGELFTERLSSCKNVIELEDVQRIIDILGSPEQFCENENEPEDKRSKTFKRYYRDMEHAMIGGVAAGLSAYSNVDVTLIRICMVVLVFVGFGTIVPIYLMVWLFTPAAISLSQKCEMHGEPISLKKIKEGVDYAQKYMASDTFKTQTKEIGERLGGVLGWFCKAIFVFIATIFIAIGACVILSLIFGFVSILLNPHLVETWHHPFVLIGTFSVFKLSLLFSSLILLFGIPMVSIIYSVYQISNPELNKPKSFGWLSFLLWLVGLLIVAYLVIQTIFLHIV